MARQTYGIAEGHRSGRNVVSVQQKYHDFISKEYSVNLHEAWTSSQDKLEEIYKSRLLMKQVLDDNTASKHVDYNSPGGNNQDSVEGLSRVVYPIVRAVDQKYKSDMTAHGAIFEYETNSGDEKICEATFVAELEIARQLNKTGNIKALNDALIHFLESGTIIAEPYSYSPVIGRYRKKVNDAGELVYEKAPQIKERMLSFNVYDPLSTFVDPHAKPGHVAETAAYCIVTLGVYSIEKVQSEFNIKVNVSRNDSNQPPILYIEDYVRQLQEAAGTSDISGLMVRRYYRASDGKVFTVIDDAYVVKEEINSLGIYGRLPFAWCPIILDPDSPYGRPLAEEIRIPSEILSTVLNQVIDINRQNLSAPLMYVEGILSKDVTSNDYQRTDLLPVDITTLRLNERMDIDLKKLFFRDQMPALDRDTQFIFEQALTAVWFVTGLNPTSLSGFQEKQVRVSGVADMINNASIRSSSTIIKNFETYFMNDLASMFHMILVDEFDQFPQLSASGVTREQLEGMGTIRVLNGSYLPYDQANKSQKAAVLLQLAATNASLDQVKVLNYAMSTMGISLKRFLRDPMELLSEDQVMALYELIRQGKTQELINFIQESAARTIAEQQGAAQNG